MSISANAKGRKLAKGPSGLYHGNKAAYPWLDSYSYCVRRSMTGNVIWVDFKARDKLYDVTVIERFARITRETRQPRPHGYEFDVIAPLRRPMLVDGR
jgi:hypothetical protein